MIVSVLTAAAVWLRDQGQPLAKSDPNVRSV